jgi:hypothetical protein
VPTSLKGRRCGRHEGMNTLWVTPNLYVHSKNKGKQRLTKGFFFLFKERVTTRTQSYFQEFSPPSQILKKILKTKRCIKFAISHFSDSNKSSNREICSRHCRGGEQRDHLFVRCQHPQMNNRPSALLKLVQLTSVHKLTDLHSQKSRQLVYLRLYSLHQLCFLPRRLELMV